MTPAKINFKMYQGATFEQTLRWESSTKVYATISSISKAAPVTITLSDPQLQPPVGWRVRVTNVAGMKEINMPEGTYYTATDVWGGVVSLNQINSLSYSTYTGGGVLEYNTPVSLTGYTARLQVKRKISDLEPVLSLTTENGGILLDDATETITIRATAQQTSALSFNSAVYDLELLSGSGKVYRFAEGSLSLKPEVTK